MTKIPARYRREVEPPPPPPHPAIPGLALGVALEREPGSFGRKEIAVPLRFTCERWTTEAFVVILGGTEPELQGLLVPPSPMLWRADNCSMARRL